ncbi:MAG: universal stress protein [Opitutaceae bacterium]|nr:universal stress protein [Opitutaceae bacterium]
MSTILSCTDGSRYAPSIYDHSAWAARRMDATVRVLHLLDPHPVTPVTADFSGAIGLDAQAALTAELVALEAAKNRVAQARAQAIVADARAHFARAGLSAVTAEALHGTLAESIGELEETADLVVLGKRGEHADFAKGHLGSNLERVVRSCHRPVLVASRAFQPIARFLLAYDGGPSAKKAVAYAVAHPLLRGLDCHLLAVGAANSALAADLAAARDQLFAAGYVVQADLVAGGNVEEVITAAVKKEKTSLLVMGAYGHSRIRHLILGSTTTTMIRTVPIPVLLFR